jgi:hypothetical protein
MNTEIKYMQRISPFMQLDGELRRLEKSRKEGTGENHTIDSDQENPGVRSVAAVYARTRRKPLGD